MWAQAAHAQLAGEGHVAALVAEGHDLVVEDGGPHVRVVGEPLTQVGLEADEQIGCGGPALADLTLAGQVVPTVLRSRPR